MTPVMQDRLRSAMVLVRSALGLKQVVRRRRLLVGVGLLVIFAGAFTRDVVGGLMLLYGAYLIVGGRLR